MTTTITADTIYKFTNRALRIAEVMLQNQFVEMTDRYNRHGWASGYDAYTAEKANISDTLSLISKELHFRFKKEREMQRSLDQARADTVAARDAA